MGSDKKQTQTQQISYTKVSHENTNFVDTIHNSFESMIQYDASGIFFLQPKIGDISYFVYHYINGPSSKERETIIRSVKKKIQSRQRGVFKFMKRNIKIDITQTYRTELMQDYLQRYHFDEWSQWKKKNGTKLSTTENGVLSHEDEIVYCSKCQVYRTLNHGEAKLVCETCGEEISILIDTQRPSFKDPPPESRNYEYKRSGHFTLWLSDVQGKENVDIPEYMSEMI